MSQAVLESLRTDKTAALGFGDNALWTVLYGCIESQEHRRTDHENIQKALTDAIQERQKQNPKDALKMEEMIGTCMELRQQISWSFNGSFEQLISNAAFDLHAASNRLAGTDRPTKTTNKRIGLHKGFGYRPRRHVIKVHDRVVLPMK